MPDELDFRLDTASEDELAALAITRLNAVLKAACEGSEWYRDRVPSSIKTPEEMTSIPLLNSSDMKPLMPPYGRGFPTGELRNAYAFASGGTTGSPKYVFYSIEEKHAQVRAAAKTFYIGGLDENTVVANLMNAGNLWPSFVMVNSALELCGCLVLPIAAQTGVAGVVEHMKAFNANAAVAIPSFMITLALHAEREGIQGLAVKTVATGGEHLFDQAKNIIAARLGTRRFVSAGYSSSDTGMLGYQCPEQSGGYHHLHADMCHMEFLDPETGLPVPDGEPGEVVVTCLTRFLTPLIRYRIGDMGRAVKGRCTCGRTTRCMELLGRSDNTITLAGCNISVEKVAATLGEFEELSMTFRVVIKSEGLLDALLIDVETVECMNEDCKTELGTRILDRFFHHNPSYESVAHSGTVAGISVHVLDPGSLPRNPRTGKVRQVVDERR
jgi:phenylacetate-coenzyme A ligase PaaK-like adenylate-forming protein